MPNSSIAVMRTSALAVQGRSGVVIHADSTGWRWRGSHGQAITTQINRHMPNVGICQGINQLPTGSAAWTNMGESPFPGAVRGSYNAANVAGVTVPPTAYSARMATYRGAMLPSIPFLPQVKLSAGITSSTTSTTVVNVGGNAVANVYLIIDRKVKKEIVLATISGTTLTMTRGQHGTIAQAHNAGDELEWIEWGPLNYNYFLPGAVLGTALTNGVGATSISADTADAFKNWKATGSVKVGNGQVVAYTARTDQVLTVSFTPNQTYAIGTNIGFSEFPSSGTAMLHLRDNFPACHTGALKEVYWYENYTRGTLPNPSGAVIDRAVYNINGDDPGAATGSAVVASATFEPVGSEATGVMKISVRNIPAGKRGAAATTYEGVGALLLNHSSASAPVGPALIHAQGAINPAIKFGHLNGMGFCLSGRTALEMNNSLLSLQNRLSVMATTCEKIILANDPLVGGAGYANAFLYIPWVFGLNDLTAVNGLAPFDPVRMPWAVQLATTANGAWAGTDNTSLSVVNGVGIGVSSGMAWAPATSQWIAFASGGGTNTLGGAFGGYLNTTAAGLSNGDAVQFGWPTWAPTGFASSMIYAYYLWCAAWDQACTNVGITPNSATRVFMDFVVPMRIHDTPDYTHVGSCSGLDTTEPSWAKKQGRLLRFSDEVLLRRPNSNIGVIDLYTYGPRYSQISTGGFADDTAAAVGRLHHSTPAVERAWAQALEAEFAGATVNSDGNLVPSSGTNAIRVPRGSTFA